MRNILVSHSINQAQEPLNESGIGRLEENRLLVTLSQEKKKKNEGVFPEIARTNERTKQLRQRVRTRVTAQER